MADHERGVVVKFDAGKGFGFIRRPNQSPTDKNLFFHVSENPQGKNAGAGDEVGYEVANGKKGLEARGLKIVAKASATVPPTLAATSVPPAPAGAAHPSRTPAAVPPQPLDIDVTFAFSEPVASDNQFELGLAVIVTDNGGNPVKNAQVSLKTNLGTIEDEPFTGKNGEAPFLVEIGPPLDAQGTRIGPPLNITTLLFTTTIRFQGKSLTRSEHWPQRKFKAQAAVQVAASPSRKAKPQPADPAQTAASAGTPATAIPASSSQAPVPPPAATTIVPPEPDNLIVNIEAFPNAEGFFLATVSTKHATNLVKGKFSVVSSETLTVKATDGNTVLGSGIKVSLETEDDGTKTILLGYTSSGQISVTFKLPTGFSVTEPITKAVLKRK